MKLIIGTLLCLVGGAVAFVRQPMQRVSAKTGISMKTDVDMEDRRAFVTKVRDHRDDYCSLYYSCVSARDYHLQTVGRVR
jgi:hypothetical protein